MRDTIRKWGVLVGTGLASLFIAVDFTIVATALSTLEAYFSVNLTTLQWIITAYGITFTAFLTPMGRLGDTYGRRLFLYVGILGFGICSIGAGLAGSVGELIFFRAIQGIFGASAFPVGMSLVAAAFPKNEQGRALGLYGGILGFGLALGPFIGGLILTFAHWRWIFFINVPVVLISLIICLIFVQKSKSETKEKVDWKGLIFLILGLASLVFCITGGPIFGWTSWWTILAFVVFVISAIFFVWTENTYPNPLIAFNLVWKTDYLIGALIFIVSVSFAWPMVFFAPLYLRDVLSYVPVIAGTVYLSMTAMTAIGSPLGGYILDKKGASFIVTMIFSALVLSYILQMLFTTHGPIWLIIIAFILFGFAWGAGNGIGVPIALSRLEQTENAGAISGSLLTILNVIGVISLAVMTAIFHYAERNALPENIHKLGLTLTAHERDTVRALISKPEAAIKSLEKYHTDFPKIMDAFRETFVFAYHWVMASLLFLTILAAIAVWILLRRRKRELR